MTRFTLFFVFFITSAFQIAHAATKPPLVPDPMLESFSTLTNDVIRWKTLPTSIQNHFGERSDFFLPQVQEFSKFIHNDENNKLNPITLSKVLKRNVPSCTDTVRIPNRKLYSTVKSAVKALWESLEGTVYRAAIVRAYDGDTSDDKLKRKFFSALLQESYKDTDKGASGFEILLNIFRPAVSPLQVKEKFTTDVKELLADDRSTIVSTLTSSGVSEMDFDDAEAQEQRRKTSDAQSSGPVFSPEATPNAYRGSNTSNTPAASSEAERPASSTGGATVEMSPSNTPSPTAQTTDAASAAAPAAAGQSNMSGLTEPLLPKSQEQNEKSGDGCCVIC
jgi:hypothetical protein